MNNLFLAFRITVDWLMGIAFMRITPLLLALALLAPGCTKKDSVDTPPNDGNAHNVTTNNLPFAVTIVETPQMEALSRLKKLALLYLQKQDYDELENLAAEGRSADDAWPDGTWRVAGVYDGLGLYSTDDDTNWLARQKALEAWIQARPECITARVALAQHFIAFAWQARGAGSANTVSDEAAKTFTERLRQAAAVLNNAKALKSKCPAYWTSVMTVALGLGMRKEAHDRVFQEMVEFYPNYQPIYFQRALFLLPRWYGAEGEWVTDLAKSADKIGGQKGDILYAQVAWQIRNYSEHKNIFEDTPTLSWERIDRGLEALEIKFPDSLEVIHMRGQMAALAGDGPKAKKYILKTGGKVALDAWVSKAEFIDFANWANAQ